MAAEFMRLPLHTSVGQETEHRVCWHPSGVLLSLFIPSVLQPSERCHSEAWWIFPSSVASPWKHQHRHIQRCDSCVLPSSHRRSATAGGEYHFPRIIKTGVKLQQKKGKAAAKSIALFRNMSRTLFLHKCLPQNLCYTILRDVIMPFP